MRRRQMRAKLNRNADQGNGRLLRGAHIRCSEEGSSWPGEKVNLLIADDEPPFVEHSRRSLPSLAEACGRLKMASPHLSQSIQDLYFV